MIQTFNIPYLKLPLIFGGENLSSKTNLNHDYVQLKYYFFKNLILGNKNEIQEYFMSILNFCINDFLDKETIKFLITNFIFEIVDYTNKLKIKKEELATKAELDCCLFDHFMIESKNKTTISNYEAISKLFKSSNIKLEKPYDMLEWIWIHMAINAAVISVIGKNGDINDSIASVHKLMKPPCTGNEFITWAKPQVIGVG